nr:hypothetical protein [Pandoravirus aubagnensis]
MALAVGYRCCAEEDKNRGRGKRRRALYQSTSWAANVGFLSHCLFYFLVSSFFFDTVRSSPHKGLRQKRNQKNSGGKTKKSTNRNGGHENSLPAKCWRAAALMWDGRDQRVGPRGKKAPTAKWVVSPCVGSALLLVVIVMYEVRCAHGAAQTVTARRPFSSYSSSTRGFARVAGARTSGTHKDVEARRVSIDTKEQRIDSPPSFTPHTHLAAALFCAPATRPNTQKKRKPKRHQGKQERNKMGKHHEKKSKNQCTCKIKVVLPAQRQRPFCPCPPPFIPPFIPPTPPTPPTPVTTVITTTSTLVIPAGSTAATVYLVGGGGAGGGSPIDALGGGGGGGSGILAFTNITSGLSATLPTTLTVVVGAGGVGTAGDGGAGGITTVSFASPGGPVILQASGGTGGASGATTSNGGSGFNGGGGGTNPAGSLGGTGQLGLGGANGSPGTPTTGGNGGGLAAGAGVVAGGGGGGGPTVTPVAAISGAGGAGTGASATGNGGAGGGGALVGSGTVGGSGAPGYVVVVYTPPAI